ncbi:MAG TPA: DUF4350 domain-containing protein [Pyrinomonadaceae bacterium]|jgi:hypothetical protein|nr:DUF4350 domain-containing protein [Pyrinomonadaceae bacterium]
MRQRLVILITVGVVLGVLIVLNALSYARVERTEDAEWNPDRSTYNSGETGTRALYDFLGESGYQVTRWREAPAALLNNRKVRPSTFVVIGRTIVPFNNEQTENLLHWVAQGGHLLIIDRRPDARLLAPSGDWHVATELLQNPSPDASSSDNPEQLTANVRQAQPAQPTILTRNVDSVMPSRFAALIKISRAAKDSQTKKKNANAATNAHEDEDENAPAPEPTEEPPPAPEFVSRPNLISQTELVSQPQIVSLPAPTPVPLEAPPPVPTARGKTVSSAPVVHLAGEHGALLVDYPHGDGRIVVLSDPFIVANNGINRADNLKLAVNTVTSGGGLIAFDEFHQGRSLMQNELFAYFAGTPVLPMLCQAAIILLALLWTHGRRFARPLPLPRVDRRSKLEFVASMAELQQRARAYDLAIENVYTRLRRILARYAGVEHQSGRAVIAAGVAARSSLDQQRLETLMRDCEDAINGGPINAHRSLELVAHLREVESTLGLRMRAREIRQAKEK